MSITKADIDAYNKAHIKLSGLKEAEILEMVSDGFSANLPKYITGAYFSLGYYSGDYDHDIYFLSTFEAFVVEPKLYHEKKLSLDLSQMQIEECTMSDGIVFSIQELDDISYYFGIRLESPQEISRIGLVFQQLPRGLYYWSRKINKTAEWSNHPILIDYDANR